MRQLSRVAATLLMLGLSSTLHARTIAEHEGVRAVLPEGSRCAPYMTVHFVPDEPPTYFSRRRLELLLAAARIGIQDFCPRLRRLHIVGRYDSHRLDYGRASAPGWQLFMPDSLHPAFSGAGMRARRPNAAAPNRGGGSRRGDWANPAQFTDDRFFFKLPTLIIHGSLDSNRGGSSGVDWRYTDMSRYLHGKSYIFYPYLPSEVRFGLHRPNPAAPKKRAPMVRLTVTQGGVEVFSGQDSERANYETWTSLPRGRHVPKVRCFRSRLLKAGDCFIILRSRSPYFQPYFLGKLIQTVSFQKPTWTAVTVGYLQESTVVQAQAALRAAEAQRSAGAAANQQAVASGRAKPNLDFEFVPVLWRDNYATLYRGTARPVDKRNGGDIHPKLMFIAHHQAFHDVCMNRYQGEWRPYEYENYYVFQSQHFELATTEIFDRYFARNLKLQVAHFSLYKRINESILLRMRQLWESGADISLNRYLTLSQERLALFIRISAEFLRKEGCQSPTTERFQQNLRQWFP